MKNTENTFIPWFNNHLVLEKLYNLIAIAKDDFAIAPVFVAISPSRYEKSSIGLYSNIFFKDLKL